MNRKFATGLARYFAKRHLDGRSLSARREKTFLAYCLLFSSLRCLPSFPTYLNMNDSNSDIDLSALDINQNQSPFAAADDSAAAGRRLHRSLLLTAEEQFQDAEEEYGSGAGLLEHLQGTGTPSLRPPAPPHPRARSTR